MFCYHEKLERKDLGGGVILKDMGSGKHMNVLHWDMADKSVLALHQHPAEQFGYVINGSLRVTIDKETATLRAGDAYFIPSNVPHSFVVIGQSEAIDIFSPVRTDLPWGNKKEVKSG